MTAQYVRDIWIRQRVKAMLIVQEHTILIRPTCKEIVSRGDDYWLMISDHFFVRYWTIDMYNEHILRLSTLWLIKTRNLCLLMVHSQFKVTLASSFAVLSDSLNAHIPFTDLCDRLRTARARSHSLNPMNMMPRPGISCLVKSLYHWANKRITFRNQTNNPTTI
jgi:hypothetical protein